MGAWSLTGSLGKPDFLTTGKWQLRGYGPTPTREAKLFGVRTRFSSWLQNSWLHSAPLFGMDAWSLTGFVGKAKFFLTGNFQLKAWSLTGFVGKTKFSLTGNFQLKA